MIMSRSLGVTLTTGALLQIMTKGCSPKRSTAHQMSDTWTPAAERAEAAAKRAEDATSQAPSAARRAEDAAACVEAMTTRTLRK